MAQKLCPGDESVARGPDQHVVREQRHLEQVAGALAVMCSLPLVPSSYWQRIASITDESKDDVQSSQARKR